KSLHFSPE
ncbi:hypothetical protein VCHC17A1_3982B, partial [Vibrio cholerae HC-17A1]